MNPRKVSLHTISNRADSAALALLQEFHREMNTGLQGYLSPTCSIIGSLFSAEIESGGRVPCDDLS